LDKIPYPDRSLSKVNLYHEFLLKRPFATVQTMRGCPFDCAFCVRTYGRDVALRSVENVLAEIEELIQRYKIKAIRFMDDTFTLNRNRVIELCEQLLKKGLRFQWSCLSRVDTVDEEMLKIMKRAGCARIYLGIESSSQRVLDCYKKGYNAVRIRPAVKMIKDNDIQVVGFFIVGGIQHWEELRSDISLAKEAKLDYIVVEKLSQYPGTSLESISRVPPFGDTLSFSSKDVPLDEAVKWEKEFYREFYFRPEYVLSKSMDSIFNIRDAAAGARQMLGYFINHRACTSRPEMI